MKRPREADVSDDSDKRKPGTDPSKKIPSANKPSESPPSVAVNDGSFALGTAATDDTEPYWVPPGMDLKHWPSGLRAQVAAIINPCYREQVVLAKPGVAQSTGITIVHLLWLEILDQIELSRVKTPEPPGTEILRMAGIAPDPELRKEAIERHLRLVHAKLKASELLLRLEEFKKYWQSNSEIGSNTPSPTSVLHQR